jgi:hypothetical protein
MIATPFPGPRSVLLDNGPLHRCIADEIQAALFVFFIVFTSDLSRSTSRPHQENVHHRNAHGAYVLWNPPNSPDLNPIEKMWDVCRAGLQSRARRAILGSLAGGVRRANVMDFYHIMQAARMTRHCYEYCGLF